MKNFLHLTLFVFSLIFIASCSSDDPTPPEGAGNWKLESFVLAGFPDAYASNENTPSSVSGITFGGGFTYTNYALNLNNDNTFDRTIGLNGAPSLIDDGLWELAEDGLSLKLTNKADAEDEFTQDWAVVINEEKRLWISQEASFGGWFRDDTLQALNSRFNSTAEINEYLNSLTPEKFAQYQTTLEIDLIYAFLKEE